MRLFVAIRFSPEIETVLMKTAAALREAGSGSFTRRENLHLTLAFLGETEDLAGARAALDEAVTGGRFAITVGGFGSFGDLLWVGVDSGGRLETLAGSVQDSLRRRGFAIERRNWKPHITVARRYRGPRPRIVVPRCAMTVTRVSLMCSERIGGVLTYTERYGIDL